MVDEDTAIPPHLLPPPRLVDGDGVIYPDDIQRLIPGRDSLKMVRSSVCLEFARKFLLVGLFPKLFLFLSDFYIISGQRD